MGFLGDLAKIGGTAAGAFLGGPVGAAAGNAVGGAVGNAIEGSDKQQASNNDPASQLLQALLSGAQKQQS